MLYSINLCPTHRRRGAGRGNDPPVTSLLTSKRAERQSPFLTSNSSSCAGSRASTHRRLRKSWNGSSATGWPRISRTSKFDVERTPSTCSQNKRRSDAPGTLGAQARITCEVKAQCDRVEDLSLCQEGLCGRPAERNTNSGGRGRFSGPLLGCLWACHSVAGGPQCDDPDWRPVSNVPRRQPVRRKSSSLLWNCPARNGRRYPFVPRSESPDEVLRRHERGQDGLRVRLAPGLGCCSQLWLGRQAAAYKAPSSAWKGVRSFGPTIQGA